MRRPPAQTLARRSKVAAASIALGALMLTGITPAVAVPGYSTPVSDFGTSETDVWTTGSAATATYQAVSDAGAAGTVLELGVGAGEESRLVHHMAANTYPTLDDVHTAGTYPLNVISGSTGAELDPTGSATLQVRSASGDATLYFDLLWTYGDTADDLRQVVVSCDLSDWVGSTWSTVALNRCSDPDFTSPPFTMNWVVQDEMVFTPMYSSEYTLSAGSRLTIGYIPVVNRIDGLGFRVDNSGGSSASSFRISALTVRDVPIRFAPAPPPSAMTVSEGESVKAALQKIAPGGVITVGPGTYTEELRIEKPVTIVGSGAPGSVVFRSPATGERKLIDIYNTSDVHLKNLTLDGSTRSPSGYPSTGVDANSVRGLTLDNVTTKNFGKNGIAITAQYVPDATLSGDVTFRDVTVSDNAWAGIAFYTLSRGVPPVSENISGATFLGTTVVSGNARGIQFGDPGDDNAVTGADGGPVALGTVAFSGNPTNVVVSDESIVTIDRSSTIGGRTVVAADFPGVTVVPVIPTVSTVTVSPTGAVVVGSDVTVSASVTPKVAGTFEIFDGATRIGGGSASGGSYTLVTSTLSAGSHTLTAVFTAASPLDHAASTSEPVTVTVNAKQTTPVAPPAADTAALEDVIADRGLDVDGTTASFTPTGDGAANPLDDFDTSKPFAGELPWTSTADSFVDLYAYSDPVFIGTFPVVNGRVQITGVDLSALASGGHHLVFIGQTSQDVAVMAITVAEDPGTPGPGTPDPGTPGPGTPDPGGPGTPTPGGPNPGTPNPGGPNGPGVTDPITGEAVAPAPGSRLPDTGGADVSPLLSVAGILVLMGLALLVPAVRRRLRAEQ